MEIDEGLIDKLLADYKNPEDLIGEQGLLKELTHALVEQCMPSWPLTWAMRSTTGAARAAATGGSERMESTPFPCSNPAPNLLNRNSQLLVSRFSFKTRSE
jgi:hypothetical protein